MKGRIIGREGRNIRAFEKRTGVDVIIDDTPGVVIVSGFDPVRREIARQALEKLIVDGRIHPSRIEEVVNETEKEMEKLIRRKGEEAAQEVNVQNLHERLVYMLGRLHFRTSYSQNVLRHSVEVAFVAGMMAEMIGLNGDVARRCGLLHDIGKAADHEMEGGHPKIGADLLKRHGESKDVVHATLGHHDEIITEYPYTMLVATADAFSASRPAPGGNRWNATSNAWKNWSRSPPVSPAWNRLSPFRPAAKCACWSAPRTRTTSEPPRSAATSPRRSRSS